MLRFLGVGGATITPSPFMQALATANGDDEISIAILDRLWNLNPVIGKTVLDLVAQRTYHKDEIYKHLASAAFNGALPSRPGLEVWIQIALLCGLLRPLGVAVAPGPRAERYSELAAAIDVSEYIAEDKPEPEPVIPTVSDEEPAAPAAPTEAGGDTSIPVIAAAPPGSPLPAPLRHLSAEGVANPRGRDRPVPVSRFSNGFSEEVLADTTTRIAGWWKDLNLANRRPISPPTSASIPSSGSRTPTRCCIAPRSPPRSRFGSIAIALG